MSHPAVTSPAVEVSPVATAPHRHHILYPSPLEALRSLLTLLVIALFVLTFLVQPFRIPSESMERTLLVGDFLLVNKTIYGPSGHFASLLPYQSVERGDVIVFHFPLNPSEHVVKRVIGIPGDRIHLTSGVVYRNGQPLTEPYVVNEPAYPDSFRDNFPSGAYTNPSIDTEWWLQIHRIESNGDIIVPAGHYFVLGDNRNHSRDSRYWGFVPRSAIVGRPFVIYFSLRRPSTTDLPELPGDTALPPQDDKLEHEGISDSILNKVVDFARWNRILRMVR
ncbi:MAG TPA: signal peptidase I [Silvibacterium sp.]|nr:signal peptidase I [Silvibacterium sp.]